MRNHLHSDDLPHSLRGVLVSRRRVLFAVVAAGLLLSGPSAAWQGVQGHYLVPPPWPGCAGARGWGVVSRTTGLNQWTGSTRVEGGTWVATPLASPDVRISGQATLCVTGWDNDVAAQATTGSGTTGLIWTALSAGSAANAITVQIVASSSAGTTATLAVVGSAITVTRLASANASAVAAVVTPATGVRVGCTSDCSGIPAAVGPIALSGGRDGTGPAPTTWTPPVNTRLIFSGLDAPTVPLSINGTLVRPTGGTIDVSLALGEPRRGWPVQLIAGTLSGTWAAGTLPAGTHLQQDSRGLWLQED